MFNGTLGPFFYNSIKIEGITHHESEYNDLKHIKTGEGERYEFLLWSEYGGDKRYVEALSNSST